MESCLDHPFLQLGRTSSSLLTSTSATPLLFFTIASVLSYISTPHRSCNQTRVRFDGFSNLKRRLIIQKPAFYYFVQVDNYKILNTS
ncbi:hypothetical protein L1887_11374 [Cichorium endivia]|nr:hypothetical protein L1887_11374 [Cichorium endivia]